MFENPGDSHEVVRYFFGMTRFIDSLKQDTPYEVSCSALMIYQFSI